LKGIFIKGGMQLAIDVSHIQGNVPITILCLQGDFDESARDEFDQIVKKEMDEGAKNFIIDFADVQFLSSAGISSLHLLYNQLHANMSEESKKARTEGVKHGTYQSPHLKLINTSRNVQKAINMTGLDMYLSTYGDENEAVAAF